MKTFARVSVCTLFFIVAYFLIKEGFEEGTTKQKMYRQMYPQSLGGKNYHRSYSTIAGIACFLAASYILYLLLFDGP
jgi:hypothetical protein